MIIDCISDLHGYKPKLEGGDLLIVAGDLTARDTKNQHEEFKEWLVNLPYEKKVVIAGNHDGFLTSFSEVFLGPTCIYLRDCAFEFKGIKIYGSPWTPEFLNWHFMKKRGKEIEEVWDKIPMDTEILITHGPPYGVLDKVNLSSRGDKFKLAGCEELRIALERVKPKLHVFGHIHSEGGKQLLFKHQGPNTICVNAAIMDEDYNPVHQPVRIIL